MSMAEEQIGADDWLDRVFLESACEDIFEGHHPSLGIPVLVLLGGQPAAGKTQAQNAILDEHITDDLVEVTGDDLREYHPDYLRLAREEPLNMPSVTAPVSGGLVSRALNHALEHRYSVLLEGTFRDSRMVTATASRFADAGYRVEVVAVATPAAVSRLSIEMRSLSGGYPKIGRWTPPAAHETALERSHEVVDALEQLPKVVRIQIFSREGLLYANTREVSGGWRQPMNAANVFQDEQRRRLVDTEAARWLADYAEIFHKATMRPGYFGAETVPTYFRLQEDAHCMIQGIAPHSRAVDWQQEQDYRNTFLMRLQSH